MIAFLYYLRKSGSQKFNSLANFKHRHAERARVIFCDSIRRTVYSNDLVKFFWLRYAARKKLGIYDVHTMLHR